MKVLDFQGLSAYTEKIKSFIANLIPTKLTELENDGNFAIIGDVVDSVESAGLDADTLGGNESSYYAKQSDVTSIYSSVDSLNDKINGLTLYPCTEEEYNASSKDTNTLYLVK